MRLRLKELTIDNENNKTPVPVKKGTGVLHIIPSQKTFYSSHTIIVHSRCNRSFQM